MTIGEKIKILRTSKGLNQEELAQKVGTSKQCISKYEHDVITPTLHVLIKLSDLFEVSLDYLAADKKNSFGVKDKRLLTYFHMADNFPPEKRKLIKELIQTVAESL